jgi:hypothetical protein
MKIMKNNFKKKGVTYLQIEAVSAEVVVDVVLDVKPAPVSVNRVCTAVTTHAVPLLVRTVRRDT